MALKLQLRRSIDALVRSAMTNRYDTRQLVKYCVSINSEPYFKWIQMRRYEYATFVWSQGDMTMSVIGSERSIERGGLTQQCAASESSKRQRVQALKSGNRTGGSQRSWPERPDHASTCRAQLLRSINGSQPPLLSRCIKHRSWSARIVLPVQGPVPPRLLSSRTCLLLLCDPIAPQDTALSGRQCHAVWGGARATGHLHQVHNRWRLPIAWRA